MGLGSASTATPLLARSRRGGGGEGAGGGEERAMAGMGVGRDVEGVEAGVAHSRPCHTDVSVRVFAGVGHPDPRGTHRNPRARRRRSPESRHLRHRWAWGVPWKLCPGRPTGRKASHARHLPAEILDYSSTYGSSIIDGLYLRNADLGAAGSD
uniref:Uncharacterized protein n=1 Tax=Ananas comosus var. bracteatus TaxID=296719 RepID=A0A6V7QRE4_ANACO